MFPHDLRPAPCYLLWQKGQEVGFKVPFFFSSTTLLLLTHLPPPRAHMLSHVTPWTAARQAPLSMDFSRQEYWSGLPFPSP